MWCLCVLPVRSLGEACRTHGLQGASPRQVRFPRAASWLVQIVAAVAASTQRVRTVPVCRGMRVGLYRHHDGSRMKMPAVQSTGTILVSAAVLFATCLAGPVDAQESSTPARLALFPSDVVSPGTLQLQAGTSYANTSADETFRIGGMVLRYGVGPVELQAEPGSYVVRRGGEPYRGLEDLTFGMKTTLFRSAGGMVQVSGQGTLTVPTGAAEVTSGDPNITLSTMADLAIADGLFFSTSLDWLSPHFAGDESWTVGLFPAMAVPFLTPQPGRRRFLGSAAGSGKNTAWQSYSGAPGFRRRTGDAPWVASRILLRGLRPSNRTSPLPARPKISTPCAPPSAKLRADST